MTGTGLGTTVALPDPPAGWFDHDYVVLLDGRLAILRTDWDYHAKYQRWAKAFQNNDLSARMPSMAGRPLRVSIFDGSAEQLLFEVESPRFPIIDRLADGRWLLADARAEPRARNGRFLDANGAEAGRFIAGDGIQDLACAPDGGFWIGYFDEGIFGGDQAPDGHWPIASAGLVRFAAGGDPLWRFNTDRREDYFIADCYALTLNGNTAWLCPYPDFPIVRVENGRKTLWRNPAGGAQVMAVADDHVLLAGGYGEEAERLALLRLRGDEAEAVGETKLPPAGPPALRRAKGRNGILHLVQAGQWRRIRVADAIAGFGG